MHRPSIAAIATALLVLTGGVAGVVAAHDGAQQPTDGADGADDDRTDRADRLGTALGLTDARTTELRALVRTERAAGASRAEVATAVERQLLAWDVPRERIDRVKESWLSNAADRRHHGFAGRVADELGLAPHERTHLHALAHELHADGADRGEIRRALIATLSVWGYHDETIRSAVVDARLDAVGDRLGLTDRETAQLAAGVEERRDEGASRAETREYVRSTLVEWGYLDGNGDDAGRDGDRSTATPTDEPNTDAANTPSA